MTNPARRYREYIAAQKAKLLEKSDQNASEYDLILFKLKQDAEILRQTQSIQTKAEMKAKMIPQYMPWVNGVLTADQGQQDEILVTVLIWMLDADQIEDALKLAHYAIKHKLVANLGFERTLPCIIADEILASAKRKEISAELMAQAITLLHEQDMPDLVKAKLYRVHGESLMREKNPQFALKQFKTALQIDEGVGVATLVKKLEREYPEPDQPNGEGDQNKPEV